MPRFNEFRFLPRVRRGAPCCNCGRGIQPGDEAHWAPKTKRHAAALCCNECWGAWAAENAEADRYERTAFGGWY